MSNYISRKGCNVFAKKSALVVQWLLIERIGKKSFSIRDVFRETNLSIGLIQKVFRTLVLEGYLETNGIRTSKRFSLKRPKALLKKWISEYSLIEKCKIYTYRSGLKNVEIHEALKHSKLGTLVCFALHSAAEYYDCKNTNLDTVELYLLEPKIKSELEKKLLLEPCERGYDLLLIEPYYKDMLIGAKVSPPLLTFLDLYNFPLRGHEQATYFSEKADVLKKIYREKK